MSIFYPHLQPLRMLQLLSNKNRVKSKGKVLELLLNVMLQWLCKKSTYHELHPRKLHIINYNFKPSIH